MENIASQARDRIREARCVLALIDLAGFTRAAAHAEAIDVAVFLDRYYGHCSDAVARGGGRVVKFMGDGVFATFDEARSGDAVREIVALSRDTRALDNPWGLRLGANVHCGVVAEGEIGPPGNRRYDVFGANVNYLFRMGGGAAIRLSEPVYRNLANEDRGPWRKEEPPAVYTLES